MLTEITQLREEIRKHDRLYYVEAAPVISDLEYDRLMQRLRQLEAEHPEWITPDSPTQRVGGSPVRELVSVPHTTPMLSIENSYSIGELRDFGNRVEKTLAQKMLDCAPVSWSVELKIDGVAASIRYEDGVLVQGLTRGDGLVGDDITHKLTPWPVQSSCMGIANDAKISDNIKNGGFLCKSRSKYPTRRRIRFWTSFGTSRM